jgi:soluble lytic murein transglycosylase-like protein
VTREQRLHTYGPILVDAFVRHGLPGVWGVGLARQESDFDASAKNLEGGDAKRGGSFGLCQVTLLTARSLRGDGVTPEMLCDASFNADVAAELVAQLRDRYRGVVSDILAAYNSGKPWAHAPTRTQKVYVPNVIKHIHYYARWAQGEEAKCRQRLSLTG